MKGKKNRKTLMEKLAAGYEQFVKGKEVNKNGRVAFNNRCDYFKRGAIRI
jgi:hypothetical protein